MNNEPVAWMDEINTFVLDEDYKQFPKSLQNGMIPLYTHPVKELKCIVKDCENHKHEGSFNGDVCSPCYQFIAHGKGAYSQAYRNAKPAELTDEEILEAIKKSDFPLAELSESAIRGMTNFARAILRKARE